MATSGSINFGATRDEIIKEALELLGVLDINGTPSSDDLASCATSLNMMLKSWQADGVNMHAVQRTFLFFTKDVNEYLLGTTANFSTDFNQTKLDGAHSSGATSITLDSVTGITTGTRIVVALTDGSNSVVTASGAPVGKCC